MKDSKEENKNSLNLTNKTKDELKNEIINYTVFNMCISLLSGVQIKCLDKKEKDKNENNETCFKHIPTIYNPFKNCYLEDWEIFNILPKKAFHSENVYNVVSFYKNKTK
ncbi:hypothetical protein YYC_03660 [Plasmodium yoelii 17X]|uniref:Uncharacterized protein n=4 Tax=Plasmodium yoelii TaxID=5861 RepID=A0AAF0B2B0_PLAYO|nr:conserved Plasmodium protein, unknown function [Plasmodium yoelii]EAA21497.1 hypothetical protein [Plasmodium yoelii yoelii]ETB58904.1 hypothetical protein YYC_03660 [Plasmodium yoelii 17X]WBY55666.1 hypothetical protein Py17XNL_000504639 [Plasmodium yoelii yoelii]CDU16734.1 conserved Plasmodium protein, unknown function [Plasmodium yoelii]VTZ74294.1 conserved Plasmodium protein, unknown function [Plasmodium yoelii]|eukprot:XP_729932.1 conserved Plasmodium protein, unknown function [Plasmodium yoelii]